MNNRYNMKSDDSRTGLRTRDVCCILVLGVIVFAGGIVGGIFIGIYAYHGGPAANDNKGGCGINQDAVSGDDATTSTTTTTGPISQGECKTCPRRNPVLSRIDPEIFAPLTSAEMAKVRDFMIQNRHVSDTIGINITLQSNYIIAMDITAPSKEKVLNHFDRNGEFPGRYATVIIVRGARSEPDCMEYLVGPLGNEQLTSKPMYSDGEIAFEARPIDSWEYNIYTELLKPLQTTLDTLIKESFDGADFSKSSGLKWWPYNGAPGIKEKEREVKLNAFFNPDQVNGDYHLLDMLPLSVVIHCPGNNISTWYVHNIYYISQGPFNTAEDLLQAYNNGTIRKMKLPKGYKETIRKRFYVGRDDSMNLRPNVNVPPPRTYEPAGPRYTIEGHHVKWMGWSFDASSRMMRGPAIFDVNYKNDRVAYEISLNDIALIYGSDSFERSNVVFTDATYSIGLYNGVLKGVDCPEHATVLTISYYDAFSGNAVTVNAMCVFEADGEEALWRHKPNSYQGGLRNSFLVVRLSATLVNYDYIVDFNFHLDGKVYTKVKASGFIQTAYWDAENPNRGDTDDSKDARDAFGFRVTDIGHGIIHDHMFGFKVDMDVLGTNNSFEVIHFKSGDVVDAFKKQNPSVTQKPDYFTFNVTRYVEYETVEKEQGYRINLDNPKLWTVVNENYRNKWGVKRGYMIAPLATSTQTMAESHPAMQALSFTKYNCAVTKRKDTEQFLTSIFDGFRFDNSKEDLDKKLDNENIRNEDLVNWVTFGFLHVPSSEDVPMTVTVESGFVLKPYNFFDKTDVYDMPSFYSSPGEKNQRPPSFEPCLENDEN